MELESNRRRSPMTAGNESKRRQRHPGRARLRARAGHPPHVPRAPAHGLRRDDQAGAAPALVGAALARRRALRVRGRRARRRQLSLRVRAPGRATDGVQRRLQGGRPRRAPRLHADLRADARRRRGHHHRDVRGARRRHAAHRSASSIRRRKCSTARSRRAWSAACARRSSSSRRLLPELEKSA